MSDEARTDTDRGDARAAEPADDRVTSLLEDLDVLDSVSALDMRVLDVEQQLRKVTDQVDMAGREQVGELEVMRARISDLVVLLREAASGQEVALAELDGNLATLLEDRVKALTAQVAEVRDEAAAHAQATVAQLDETVREVRELTASQTQSALARLDEALAMVRGETSASIESSTTELEALAGRVNELVAALSDHEVAATSAIEAEGAHRRNELDSLEKRLNGRIDVSAEAAADARRRLDERIEALRRELDATSGELRAHVAVALGDISARMDAHENKPSDPAVSPEELQAVALEIAAANDETERRLRDLIRDEATNRLGAVTDVAELAAEALRLARQAVEGVAADEERSQQVASSVQALGARLGAMQSTLAHAVNEVASELGGRVATVAGQLDALREGLGRANERVGALDALEQRLEKVEAAQQDRRAEQDLISQIGDLQRELSRVEGRLDSFARQATAADERAEDLRRDLRVLGDEVASADAWRSEVRDLSTRTSELAARVAEAETIARRAGNAVVEAVKQAQAEAAAESTVD
ncbi:MAG: hypothetical protein R3249_06875 [Nitriliruptorales bacterium]|nr:hypothetical protein [Nitriliruptorales bacterium]